MTLRLVAYLLGTVVVAVTVWMPITVVRLAFHATTGAFSRHPSRERRC